MIPGVIMLGVIGGLGLWSTRRLLAPSNAVDTPSPSPATLLLFVLAVAINTVIQVVGLETLGITMDAPEDLPSVIAILSLAGLASTLLAVGLVRVTGQLALADLGLKQHRGRNPLLIAPAVWMTYLPVFALVSWANLEILPFLDIEAESQQLVEMFLANDAARTSPIIWVGAVILIPFSEELFFRGCLYGGLKSLCSRPVAMVGSALVFGLLHEPSVALPVTCLGIVLAWLYERTGSLIAPALLHGLHNGIQLSLVCLFPETMAG